MGDARGMTGGDERRAQVPDWRGCADANIHAYPNLQICSGELVVGSTVRPMCVDQSRAGLDDAKTVYEEMCGGADELVIGGRAVPSRAYCTWYNFRGGDQQKRVGDLSGGERNRLQLAKTLLQGGNLLLLGARH